MQTVASDLVIIVGDDIDQCLSYAECRARRGDDLLIASNNVVLPQTMDRFESFSGCAQVISVDLATQAGIEQLCNRIGSRAVTELTVFVNPKTNQMFLDQDPSDWIDAIETGLNGSLLLIQTIARSMRAHRKGCIQLLDKSADRAVDHGQPVSNGISGFLENFATALQSELAASSVTVNYSSADQGRGQWPVEV